VKNHFKPGQLLRFVHRNIEDAHIGYLMKHIKDYADPKLIHLTTNRSCADVDRRVPLDANSLLIFVKHCPGINSNWDRMPGAHIEHDCIYCKRGHAIVLVNEEMLQVSYEMLCRIK